MQQEPTMEQYDYVHFTTPLECEIHLMNNKNINVAYKCCDGKGFARRTNQFSIPIHCTQNKFIPIKGTCDICFLEETSLYNTCSTCSQPFCKDCLTKISSKVCPYCRGKLTNNF